MNRRRRWFVANFSFLAILYLGYGLNSELFVVTSNVLVVFSFLLALTTLHPVVHALMLKIPKPVPPIVDLAFDVMVTGFLLMASAPSMAALYFTHTLLLHRALFFTPIKDPAT